MSETALGQEVERVMGVHQGEPGATLVVVGGVHGNEPAGILAARRVLARLRREGELKGRFVALAGNLTALRDPDPHVRYVDRDLNRMFTDALVDGARQIASEDRYVEQQEALELIESIEAELASSDGAAFVLDMHTVSSPSPAFIFVEDSLPARRFARRFEVPLVFGFEDELPGLLVDYTTSKLGLISMLLEAGLHDDPASVVVHEAAIWVALEGAGMIDPASIGLDPHAVLAGASGGRAGEIYDVRHREPITHPDFEVDQHLHSFDGMRQGRTLVAVQAGSEIMSPMTGLLFLPNRQQDRRLDDDGFFVVLRIGRLWLWLSALIRQIELVHRLLPLVAPGVRRDPRRPGVLLVDPHIAPVFKREMFHLLGYRLLRHGEDVHLSRWRRALRGGVGVVHSIGMMLAGIFRGGERSALRSESPEDWIVARRRLDLFPPGGGRT